MHHHNPFIQCQLQLTHHQYTTQMQPKMPHQLDTDFLFTMAPYSLQQCQPGAKQLKIVLLNLGLN